MPEHAVRGQTAHRKCHQFLVALTGDARVAIDNGTHRATVHLTSPELGLHVPPMNWTTIFRSSPDVVLLVLASDIYEDDDYIRDYDPSHRDPAN